MTGMDIPTDPDERTRLYERYRKAHKTVKDLKPIVDTMAAQDLAAGATTTELAERTGMGEEVFRRKARKADVPVDPRYAERAAKLRARNQETELPAGPVANPRRTKAAQD